jgi:hypothetical protein
VTRAKHALSDLEGTQRTPSFEKQEDIALRLGAMKFPKVVLLSISKVKA